MNMATTLASPALTLADFKGKVDPDWCPGCGDFGVLASLKSALAELKISPHDVITISGIGCSSNLPGYINTYGSTPAWPRTGWRNRRQTRQPRPALSSPATVTGSSVESLHSHHAPQCRPPPSLWTIRSGLTAGQILPAASV
jgi:hypothetical protein